MKRASVFFVAVVSSFVVDAQAQTPAAGTVTAVPASARLDEDGDGAKDAAAATTEDGFCGLFLKANRTAFPNTVAQTQGLIDATTDRFSPDPRSRSWWPSPTSTIAT